MSKRASQKLKSRFFMFLLMGVFILLLFAFGREHIHTMQVKHYIAELEEEKVLQEQKQLETMALIEELSSEYFLESEGRIKQGLGHEGETAIIIEQPQNTIDLDVQPTDSAVTNVTKWFYYFFSQETFEAFEVYEDSQANNS